MNCDSSAQISLSSSTMRRWWAMRNYPACAPLEEADFCNRLLQVRPEVTNGNKSGICGTSSGKTQHRASARQTSHGTGVIKSDASNPEGLYPGRRSCVAHRPG